MCVACMLTRVKEQGDDCSCDLFINKIYPQNELLSFTLRFLPSENNPGALIPCVYLLRYWSLSFTWYVHVFCLGNWYFQMSITVIIGLSDLVSKVPTVICCRFKWEMVPGSHVGKTSLMTQLFQTPVFTIFMTTKLRGSRFEQMIW